MGLKEGLMPSSPPLNINGLQNPELVDQMHVLVTYNNAPAPGGQHMGAPKIHVGHADKKLYLTEWGLSQAAEKFDGCLFQGRPFSKEVVMEGGSEHKEYVIPFRSKVKL